MVETKQDSMYLVSKDGEVFSLFTNKLLKLSESKGTGYIVVNIRVRGERQPVYVHRLVAEAFIDNPNDLPEVNHKDGNKHNNIYTNLEWVTGQQNKDHAKATGLIKIGSQLKRAKLTEEKVEIICQMLQEGFTTGNILNIVDFYVTRSLLLNIRARRDWKHISEKYSWEAFLNKRKNTIKCND